MGAEVDPSEGGAAASPWPAPLLDRLARGEGLVHVFSGGSDDERSRMLEAVAAKARERRWAVSSVRATPFDEEVPFGALLAWLRELAPEGARRTAALPSLLMAVWESHGASVMAAGRDAPSVPEASELSSMSHSPEEARAALWELFAPSKGPRKPIVCVVHDADHLDPASREWIASVSAMSTGVGLGIVLAFREPVDHDAAWTSAAFPRGFVWHDLPGGGSASKGADSPVSRLESGPEGARRVLRAAALAGPDADLPLLASVLGMAGNSVRETLRPLAAVGLVEVAGDRVSFPEPSVASLVVEGAPSAELRQLHRAIAAELERSASPLRGPKLFRSGDHWAAAGVSDPGVARLISSAQECERWGSPGLAERRLRRALLLAQQETSAAARELEEAVLSHMAHLKSRSEEAGEAVPFFRRAMELARARNAGPRTWAPLVAGWARAATLVGQDPEKELLEAVNQVRGKEPDLEARLLRSYSFFLTTRGRSPESIAAAEQAFSLASRGSDPLLKVRCALGLANAYLYDGGDAERARRPLEEALALEPELRESPELVVLLYCRDRLALLELSVGNTKEALRRGEEALGQALRAGSPWSVLTIMGNTVEYALKAGDLARAQELTQEFRARLERSHVPPTDENHLQLLLVEAELAAAQGQYPRAREVFRELAETSERGGIRYMLAQAIVLGGEVAAALGDEHGVTAALQRLRKEGLERALGPEHQRVLGQLKRRRSGKGA